MKTPEVLQEELFSEYGPYVPLSRVWRQLSFPSLDAARKAVSRGAMPIECFALPGRRGRFVRAGDIAHRLSDALGRASATVDSS